MKLIGKEFDSNTIKLRTYLDKMKVTYQFADIDFDQQALDELKLLKVISIPILINKDRFIVGFNPEIIKRFLKLDI